MLIDEIVIDDKGHRRIVRVADGGMLYAELTIMNTDNGTSADVSLTLEEAKQLCNALMDAFQGM